MFPTVRGKESAIGESFSTGRSRNAAIGGSFGRRTLFPKNFQSPKGDYTGKSAIGESFSTGRLRNAAIGGSFGRRTLFPKNFQSPKKKKKRLLTHYHRSKALVETDISIASPGRGPSETSSWLFFFFFFHRAIFTRKTCTGVSSTLCENFGPIRPRVVAQSRKDRLPAPLFAIFRLFRPLSDEEKTFSPSSGNFRQRGTEISSISPGFPTRLVDPQKKEPIS